MSQMGRRARVTLVFFAGGTALLGIVLAITAAVARGVWVAATVLLAVALAVAIAPAVALAWRQILPPRARAIRIRVLLPGVLVVLALTGATAGAALAGNAGAVWGALAPVAWATVVALVWPSRRTLGRVPGIGRVMRFVRGPVKPKAPPARRMPVASAAPTPAPSQAPTGSRPILPLGATRPSDLEHAAKRGYVSASLRALELYTHDTERASKNARARMTRAYILDRERRIDEADVEVRLAVLSYAPILDDVRHARRWVNLRAREGAVDAAIDFAAQHEREHGYDPAMWLEVLAATPGHLSEEQRLEILSRTYREAGFVGLEKADPDAPLSLGNLRGAGKYAVRGVGGGGPLVSIIVPCFDAEDTIEFAVHSLLEQTYRRTEVLVVDDGSSDRTVTIVDQMCQRDGRVRLIVMDQNAGAYVARNAGLAQARGDLVTVHDADDYAHPQQIATQVAYHRRAASTIATIVQRIRVDDELVLRSSIARSSPTMMLETEVATAMGGWQALRMNADTEFTERFQRAHGKGALRTIKNAVPFTLARMAERNLTADGPRSLKYVVHASGVRDHYQEAFRAWHASDRFTPVAPGVAGNTPFPLPRLIDAALRDSPTTRHVDVVLMSDLVLPGGTTSANIREIRALRAAGKTVGLINHPRFPERIRLDINRKYWDVIDGDAVRLLTVGEHVSTDLLVCIHPPMAAHLADELPGVRAERAVLVVNQAPRRLYDGSDLDLRYYELDKVVANLEERFEVPFVVAPLSPSIRQILAEAHAEELARVRLSDEDWLVCLDADDWPRPARRAADGRIVIGRHSRDGIEKWPENPTDLLGAYPDVDPFEVRVLGGANIPRKTIGRRPANWLVHKFDTIDPREFIAGLDVYSYFTHSTMVEAFGLAPLEALAVGVPLVTSPKFEPIFGDAAIYCAPTDVPQVVTALLADPASYAEQVSRGLALVRDHYSFAAHVGRVSRISGLAPNRAGAATP